MCYGRSAPFGFPEKVEQDLCNGPSAVHFFAVVIHFLTKRFEYCGSSFCHFVLDSTAIMNAFNQGVRLILSGWHGLAYARCIEISGDQVGTWYVGSSIQQFGKNQGAEDTSNKKAFVARLITDPRGILNDAKHDILTQRILSMDPLT